MFNFYQLAENFVLKNLEHLNFGQLQLENHDGKTYSFGKNSENLKANLKINSKNFYFNLIKGGSSALAESYVNNDFSTKNLTALIELSAKNLDITNRFTGLFNKLNIFHFLKRFFTSNNKTKSVEYISKHYDLGNDFFSIWLDKTLTYSCAIYNDNNEQLDIAQINKYNKLIDLIKPKAGSKILEIGCGWGGFAEHLAKNNDIKLDCITISKKQLEFAKERIFKAGLNEKVNIKFLDYRDVKENYDSIASIEMIEAVGEKNLKTYFSTISKNLNQGGVAAIQAIIIQDKLYDSYRKNQDFIQKYIFPGGVLPTKSSPLRSHQQRRSRIGIWYRSGRRGAGRASNGNVTTLPQLARCCRLWLSISPKPRNGNAPVNLPHPLAVERPFRALRACRHSGWCTGQAVGRPRRG